MIATPLYKDASSYYIIALTSSPTRRFPLTPSNSSFLSRRQAFLSIIRLVLFVGFLHHVFVLPPLLLCCLCGRKYPLTSSKHPKAAFCLLCRRGSFRAFVAACWYPDCRGCVGHGQRIVDWIAVFLQWREDKIRNCVQFSAGA